MLCLVLFCVMWRLNFALATLWLALVAADEEAASDVSLGSTNTTDFDDVDTEDSQVIVLTDKDFDEQVKDGMETPWFVEFYAPWCGHCKQLEPKWAELPALLDGKVKVAKVDATVEKAVAEEYKIQGFPTLKLIAGGKMYAYEGDREADAMAKWAAGEYKSASGSSLPKNTSPLERALAFIKEALNPAAQVQAYVPWLLPAVFILGSMFGFALSSFAGGRVKVPKELNEVFKVNAVRDQNKSAGMEMDAATMKVTKVETDRPELSKVKIGDTIIGVDGASVIEADEYRRYAHGKEKFVITMGRATKTNSKEKKDT